MSQTSVLAGGQAIGVAGQAIDSGVHDIVSGFSQETSNQIPFGFGVRAGSTQDGYLLPTGSSGGPEIEGLSVFDYTHSRAAAIDGSSHYSGDIGASGLLPQSGLQIARKGRFLVPVAYAVQRGDRAFCYGVGTGTFTPGLWAGTGVGGASYVIDCTSKAQFRTSTYTAADGSTKVAVLEVDFTTK
jgi:hypothetical protein